MLARCNFTTMPVKFALALLLSLFLVSVCDGQESSPSELEMTRVATPPQTEPTAQQTPRATNQPQEEKHPRLFGIFPTYDISNVKTPPPLSTRGKFRLFAKGATDPYNLVYTAASAGLSQASNDLAEYGQGAAGYGKRLGAGLAYQTSDGFFGTFLLPSVFHQDPRYFRKGEGPFKNRLAHALIRPVITRKDSGGSVFNWSGILGRVAANGLSNAYFPENKTGVGGVFSRTAIQAALSVTGTLFNEFGPDVEKRILGKKQRSSHSPSFAGSGTN